MSQAINIEIQALTVENSGLLKNVAAGVFDNAIDPEQLTAFLRDPRHVMFIATDGPMVVGMASGFEYFHPDKSPQLFINEVGVAPTHRNRQIGRRLVAALIEFAKDLSCSYAWLGTENDNLAAQRCFRATPEARQPQPFLLFEWDLGD